MELAQQSTAHTKTIEKQASVGDSFPTLSLTDPYQTILSLRNELRSMHQVRPWQ